MTSVQSRVLTFVVGVPAISVIILLLPQANHLVFNLVAILFIVLGARETANLYRQKGYAIPAYLPFAAALLPLSAWLAVRGYLPKEITEYLLIVLVILVLTREINAAEETDFSTVLPRIGGSLLTLLYPSFFAVYVVRLTGFDHAAVRLFAFLILIFLNDTAAYIFGSLFGRKSRRLFRVSPNKSLVGFVSGLVVCILSAWVLQIIFPELFSSVRTALIAGLVLGLAGIVGDLVESALKRSAVIKDSGDIIPGRGGILDSIDSIVFAAPFYYLILLYL